MKWSLRLVFRYLVTQRKRGVLILSGLGLAVALMVFTGIIGVSIRESQVQRARGLHGSYHGTLTGLRLDQVESVRVHPMTRWVGVEQVLGTQRYPEGLAIDAQVYDHDLVQVRNLRLIEGDWPRRPGEIVLEEWILRELDLETEVSLSLGTTTKDTFAIVGVIEDLAPSVVTGHAKGWIFSDLDPSRPFSVLIELTTQRSYRSTLDDLVTELGLSVAQVQENVMLIQALEGDKHLNTYPYLFLGLFVLVTSATMIFNVFHISVFERVQQFRLLRSIGVTPRQLRGYVLGEALVLGLVAIPLGIAIGIAGTYGLVYGGKFLQGEIVTLIIYPRIYIASSLFCLLTIALAAAFPARLAARTSPLEALKCEGSTVGEFKVPPKDRLLGRLMGIEGRLAYLNVLRQKKRFWSAVVSLSLGSMLFVALSYFFLSVQPNILLESDFPGEYVLNVRGSNWNSGYDPGVIEVLSAWHGVSEVRGTQVRAVQMEVHTQMMTDRFKEFYQSASGKTMESAGMIAIGTGLYGYPESVLISSSVEAGTLDLQRLKTEAEVLLINTYPVRRGVIPVTNLQVGSMIALRLTEITPTGETQTRRGVFRIAAVLSKHPTATDLVGVGPGIVMHQDQFTAFVGSDLIRRVDVMVEPDADVPGIEAGLRVLSQSTPQGYLSSYREQLQRIETERRQILYGLVYLVGGIVLIGVLSIVNTLHTNLILRTREFGVMRAIGCTPLQMKAMVLWEGLLFGVCGGIGGAIGGVVLAYLTYYFNLRHALDLAWQVPWGAILVGVLGSIALGLVAAWRPLRRLTSFSVVGAIRYVG